MSFQTYAVGYPVTFLIMLISSVLTGTLAAKLKTHAKLSAQLAFRTQILFDTDRLLQREKGETEILGVTCTQLIRLLNRNITAYIVKNGTLSEGKLFSGEKENSDDFLTQEEQDVARWTYENRQRAGVSTHHFPQAKCLYLAIRSGNNVYGVIGIPMQKETLDSYEYSILLSVINGCALAMENAQNAMEKEKNAILAKNEQLRADLLRAISHDLRTPLCSISGNADMLLGNSERLDEATRHQIYTDIYDDSEWLIGVVENLLSITRLNDGRLKFKFTDQLLDEVRYLNGFITAKTRKPIRFDGGTLSLETPGGTYLSKVGLPPVEARGLNPKYLLEGLEQARLRNMNATLFVTLFCVTMKMGHPHSPMILTDGKDHLAMVLPVRLKEVA